MISSSSITIIPSELKFINAQTLALVGNGDVNGVLQILNANKQNDSESKLNTIFKIESANSFMNNVEICSIPSQNKILIATSHQNKPQIILHDIDSITHNTCNLNKQINENSLNSLSYNSNQSILATAGESGYIYLYDILSDKVIIPFNTYTHNIIHMRTCTNNIYTVLKSIFPTLIYR